MPNYNNSKIYKIVNTENDKFYVGSTTVQLHQRMSRHREKQDCSSKLVGDLYKCKIILIESFQCNNKQESLKKEREYFDKYKKEGLNIVNQYRPMRTPQEKKQYETKNEKKTIWVENNKDKITEYKKKYKIKNRETTRENSKIKYTCECGSIVSSGNKSHHNKTKKHLKFITP